MKPRLFDLFCGAGGAAVGYHLAGFEVVGVDIKPQPHYPFEFRQLDVLDLGFANFIGFDATHASPPCQRYSTITSFKGSQATEPDLIGPTRELLQRTGLPYVIENVPGSPLFGPLRLCGSMFGLEVRRHRHFESPWLHSIRPPACDHSRRCIAVYGKAPAHRLPDGVQRARDLAEGQRAMGIEWMEWAELTQAIPPAYTKWIGQQLLTISWKQAS